MNRMAAVAAIAVLAIGCKSKPKPEPKPAPTSAPAPAAARTYAALPRADFNRWAVRLNLPVYWIADGDGDGAIDPGEIAALRFYPTAGAWTEGGELTAAFDAAYDAIVAASKAPPPGDDAEGTRQRLVGEDLDAGRPTLLHTDLTALPAADRAFARAMLDVAARIDALYELHNGAAALAAQLPPDAASRSLFRRNRGPRCVGPTTEKQPACSAIPGAPKPLLDVYPAEPQRDPAFCAQLEARPDAKDLLGHFTAVRSADGGKLAAVGYPEAYARPMGELAAALDAAAALVEDPGEAALIAYLRAAAQAFRDNDWFRADAAWAAMNADNSKWYVRVGPDEVYWDPCAHKAGMHLTFARIDQGSKVWQQRLVPIRQDMEALIAALAGAPYKAREVAFHLPDFIAIIVNAGDGRQALGATIGQSLPNWGPVADAGRTVAMVNINTDVDSLAANRAQAESILDAAAAKVFAGTPEPGLLTTILHEVMHNLGPTSDYKLGGKSPGDLFTGPIASMMEELKAQTGALVLIELLRARELISAELAAQSYADAIVWALRHTSQGMYTGAGARKAYSNLAAIQLGHLIDHGVLVWDAGALAANGEDKGAFAVHLDKLPAAAERLMRIVGAAKARGDRAAAEALIARYVDGPVVPQAVIAERFLRHPKPSYVYAVEL